MKYIEYINNLIKEQIKTQKKIVLFGQNINAGSCLGGLTRGLEIDKSSKIINSTNAENSLCGFGFGLMISDTSSIFFMKQLDFLLLGIDHLVNTYNIIRSAGLGKHASFTIFPIIVDNGFQGPQSSLNNFAEFCSISRIPGYSISNKIDADEIIKSKLIEPGFRIITVSQRLFHKDIFEPKQILFVNDEKTVFQYKKGNQLTIISFNFTFPQAIELTSEFEKNGIDVSLFNVNSPIETNWKKIYEDVENTKNIIILDDSKSLNIAANTLMSNIIQKIELNSKLILKKEIDHNWLTPNDDEMKINYKELVIEWKNTLKKKSV